MIDAGALLTDLRKQVKLLEADLRANEDDLVRLRAEWQAARNSQRTAATLASWLDERVTKLPSPGCCLRCSCAFARTTTSSPMCS